MPSSQLVFLGEIESSTDEKHRSGCHDVLSIFENDVSVYRYVKTYRCIGCMNMVCHPCLWIVSF